MFDFIQEKKWILGLLIIIAVGAFFRGYNHSDWMHYQLDQARDFRVISAAHEKGVGELPLQGPKAAGNVYIDSDGDGEAEDKTTLRLGPLFYYLEYISAKIFGNTPAGSAMIILILSILTIPAFFFFVRELFSDNISLGLTAIFSASLFLVVYSRFGWNPNLIPLFFILSGYGLLQASNEWQNQGRWLVVSAISFAFLSHMHFLAFTIFPVIAIIYLLWVRPRISIKYWIIAIATFLVLNTPLIVNDIKTGGENYKAFLASIGGKSEEADTSMKIKLARNTLEHAEMAWVVLTGDQNIKTPKVKKSGEIACEDKCKNTLLKTLTSLLFLFAGFVSWMWLLKRTKDEQGKNFLKLTGIWAGITFLVFAPLAFDFAPRFFLIQAPMFIVFFGFILGVILVRKRKRNIFLMRLIFLVLIASNAFFVSVYFMGYKDTQSNQDFTLSHEDLILKEKTRVTLGQMEKIVDEIMKDYGENQEPVYLEAQAEYKRAFWERIESRDVYQYDGVGDLRTPYRKGNFYIIIRTQSDFENFFDSRSDLFEIVSSKSYGTLTLYKLKVKTDILSQEELLESAEFSKRESPEFSSGAQVRYLWRQILEGCTYNYDTKKCEK